MYRPAPTRLPALASIAKQIARQRTVVPAFLNAPCQTSCHQHPRRRVEPDRVACSLRHDEREPTPDDLRPEASKRGVVTWKIIYFGHNAIGHGEEKYRLDVQSLSLSRPCDPLQDEYVIARCGHCQRLDAHRSIGLVSELAKEPEDGLRAAVVPGQDAGREGVPLRISREECLQRLDVALRERLITTPHKGDILGLRRACAAHLRLLP
jgi:hypothetical protein